MAYLYDTYPDIGVFLYRITLFFISIKYYMEVMMQDPGYIEYSKAKANNWLCQHTNCDSPILADVTLKWCQQHLYTEEGLCVHSEDI